MHHISLSHLEGLLNESNPWWLGEVPSAREENLVRAIGLRFQEMIVQDTQEPLVLAGPCGAGKTTLLQQAITNLLSVQFPAKSLLYVSMAWPIFRDLPLKEVLHLYQKCTGQDPANTPVYLFLDDLGFLEDWTSILPKMQKDWPQVRVVAASSLLPMARMGQRAALKGIKTFLMGPMCFDEYLELTGGNDLFTPGDQPNQLKFSFANLETLNQRFADYLHHGAFPCMLPQLGGFRPDLLRQRLLPLDLPGVFGIADTRELYSFFCLLAANDGGEVTIEKLTQTAGLAKNTVRKYFAFLESAFLIRVVHRVNKNGGRFRRANIFKVHLAHPALGFLVLPAPPRGELDGNMVTSGLFTQMFHASPGLYYARWPQGRVAMVHPGPDRRMRWAIDVNWEDDILQRPEEMEALSTFCHYNRLEQTIVTTRSDTGRQQHNRVTVNFYPAALQCYATGYRMTRRIPLNLSLST